MRKLLLHLLCAVSLSPAMTLATPATVIVVETESYRAGGKGGSAEVYVENGRVRIDSNEGAGNMSIIYGRRDGEPVYWLINNAEKTYVEINREAMLQTQREVEQSIETMREQMKHLPAAQREQMERTMKLNMERLGFTDAQVEYTPVSKGVKIGKWRCNHYQGERKGEKVEEVWAAAPEEMGLRPGDVDALGEMAEMFEGTGQDMPAFFSFAREGGSEAHTYEGFPVIVVTYDRGNRREKSQIIAVRSESLAADFFELPEGLSEKRFAR